MHRSSAIWASGVWRVGIVGVFVANSAMAAPMPVHPTPSPQFRFVPIQHQPGKTVDDDDSDNDDDDGHRDEKRNEIIREAPRQPDAPLPPEPPILPPLVTPTPEATSRVVNAIEDNDQACRVLAQRFGRNYVIDCIAKGYRDLARRLPAEGAYDEVRAALDTVASELEQISQAATDRRKARQTLQLPARRGLPSRSLRNITAVEGSAFNEAAQAASQVLQEGKLVLLRSTPINDPRRVHFERVADAFDGSAVLLRS